MRKPKIRELGEAFRSLFSKPVTVKFPHEPYEAPDVFRGKPVYDEETCIGCGACVQVCPALAIEMVDHVDEVPPVRRHTIHYDVCIFCGHCQLNCTTETGIRNTPEYDMTTFDRSSLTASIDHELVLCTECDAVIAPRAHIIWVAEKLGTKRFANPTLMLVADGQLDLVEERLVGHVAAGLRPDSVRVICPKCRRTTVVRELWG